MVTHICGFAANAEVVGVFDSSTPDEKMKLSDFRIDLSGTSADVALALNKLRQDPLLLGLTAKSEREAEAALLKFSLESSGLAYELIPTLDRTSIAFLPADKAGRSRVAGRRGIVQAESLGHAHARVRALCESYPKAWRIATGVRAEEVMLVTELFVKGIGRRVLMPGWQLQQEEYRRELDLLVQHADLLVVNEEEYRRCKKSLAMRPPDTVLVVTQGVSGGWFSRGNDSGVYDALQYPGRIMRPARVIGFLVVSWRSCPTTTACESFRQTTSSVHFPLPRKSQERK